jgi:glycosyltransferase involved in cell wall biosynthesis
VPAPSASSISVVVPTYNDVEHLGAALESIVAQTLAPGEIVVADDGSDDGTEQLVDSFAERYGAVMPIRYVRLETRSGVVAARTEGIAQARGDWIANCDSDDTWLATKLERQLEFLRSWSGERRLVLLGTFGYNVNEAEEVISEAPIGPSSEEDFERTRRRGGRVVVMHSSVLYSRADYLAVGGYTTEYGTADDGDFFGKMAELGVVMCVPEPLINYRKRAGSIQVAQFWEKQQSAMHLRLNLRRRAKGEPPISREQFDAQLAAEPMRRRLRRRRLWLGAYYNRVGGMNFVNGRRVTGASQLALAAIMDNSRVRHGLRRYLRTRSRT